MTTVRITFVQDVEIPDDATVWESPSGRRTGIRLADGRLLRPQLAYEIEEKREGRDDAHRDLTSAELSAIGVEVEAIADVDIEEAPED